MALHFPPSVSISKFVGGYKSVSDYTDLNDTESNDAQNVVYGPNGDIEQRTGSLRKYNRKLANTATPTIGEPITGHYYFDKLGSTSTYEVVAAGNSLYSYSSATANVIGTGLTDNSLVFFAFTQVQDPRSASDDLVLCTNGADAIRAWTGTATAVLLSSFTSATQVPVAKYLLNHKERVYAFNIIDATDADAAVKVTRTGFGNDGAADPHRFTEFFYVGGSSKDGDLRGGGVLNDQIIFYKRASVWKFSPGSGDVNDLQKMQESIGLYAPLSLVDAGDFHIFLSERGVYAFDGVNFAHLSEKVDDLLLKESNLQYLQYAKAMFNRELNQYVIYFPYGDSTRNDMGLIYDLRMKAWQPPITGRRVNFLSAADDSNGIQRLVWGDYSGFLFQESTDKNDGLTVGHNGTCTQASYTSVIDSSASFPTAGDGLAGLIVRIYEGTGAGQERVITSNTTAVISLESDWRTPLDTTSKYTVGGIDAYWRSKDYDFGGHDITKLFRHIRVRAKEEGQVYLRLHYIVDFRELANATFKDIELLEDGWIWDRARWDQTRWGTRGTLIRRKVSLRNTPNQRTNGTHLSVRFSNPRANESFRISGYDIELKAIGKR